jgi:hypothetical protein
MPEPILFTEPDPNLTDAEAIQLAKRKYSQAVGLMFEVYEIWEQHRGAMEAAITYKLPESFDEFIFTLWEGIEWK